MGLCTWLFRVISLLIRFIKILLPLAVLFAAYWAYELGYLWHWQGGVSRLCFDILDFNYDSGGGVVLTVPFATASWVQACKSAFAELEPQQRVLLERLLDQPLDYRVTQTGMQLARYGVGPPVVPKERKQQLRDSLLASPPRATAPAGPSAENLTKAVVTGAGGMQVDWLSYHESFATLGLPAQEPVVEPEEVGQALKEGRMVRFDATKVLPAHTFNVTLDTLSRLHSDKGDDILILQYMHVFKKCRELAYQRRKVVPVGALACPSPPTLGQVRRENPNPAWMPTASRIALRRLPNYINEEKMLKDLGLEGVVERPEGQIIMGHANGDTHWDEQDNLFIQASGVSVVFGVAAEYSDAIDGDELWSAKSSGMLWHEWLSKDEVRKTSIPWYYMVLKPGDAIAIPSRSFHAVYGAHNRASLQTFLEPKMHGMRWPSNPHSYWHKETDMRQAVRNLYFKSIGRLWDTKKLGIVAQGGIIEYL